MKSKGGNTLLFYLPLTNFMKTLSLKNLKKLNRAELGALVSAIHGAESQALLECYHSEKAMLILLITAAINNDAEHRGWSNTLLEK